LEKKIKYYNRNGIGIGSAALISFLTIYYLVNFQFIPHEGQQIYSLLSNGKEAFSLNMFYITSRFIVGGLLATVFYLIIRICINSFDQSIRYQKRLHAIKFLWFLFEKEHKYRIELHYDSSKLKAKI